MLIFILVKENPWDWEVNGIGKNIFALSMVGLISVVVLLICELRVWEYFKKSSAKLESSSVKANKQGNIATFYIKILFG